MSAQPLPKHYIEPRSPARLASVSTLPGRGREDAELMARVSASRDRAALDALARHYGPRLKAWLMHRGEQAQTAEDVVQDVIVSIWVNAASFDPDKANFSTWAYRLTRNRWIDHKRKHDRLQPTSPDLMAVMADAPVGDAEGDMIKTEAAKAVHEQLALLSPDQKYMLHLAFFEGLTHSQIAERTGLPLGTVKSRIRAPLKKMQEALSDYSGADE